MITLKNSSWDTVFLVIFSIGLFFMPIYPDEQAFQLISFRGIKDGVNYNNLAYFCESFFTPIPIFQLPIRWLSHIIFGKISSPISYRLIGIIIFIIIFKLYYAYIGGRNIKFVLFIGYIPFTLVMLRPEGLILLLIVISLYAEKINIKHKGIIQSLIFIILLTLHARTIFLLPLYGYLIYIGFRRWYFSALFLILACIFCFQTVDLYLKSFSCKENQHMQNIFDSLKGISIDYNLNELFKSFFHKIISINSLIQWSSLQTSNGSFPVPVDFNKKWPYQYFYGFTAFIIFYSITFIIYSLSKVRKLDKSIIIALLLLIYLGSCLIFQKTEDRFYEIGYWLPILYIVFHELKSDNDYIEKSIKIIGVISIIIFTFLVTPKFIRGWGPYALVKPLNTELTIELREIFSESSNHILLDFETFNYLKNTSSPILANFFYWYTGDLNNGFSGDLSRLKFLKEVSSSGVAMRCDRMSQDLRTLSRKKNINNFELCYLTNSDLEAIFK